MECQFYELPKLLSGIEIRLGKLFLLAQIQLRSSRKVTGPSSIRKNTRVEMTRTTCYRIISNFENMFVSGIDYSFHNTIRK